MWNEARRKALTPAQASSPLAVIPYYLRHACVSFWLRSGVSLAETARAHFTLAELIADTHDDSLPNTVGGSPKGS
ncbi:hypothetical protein ACFXC8_01700 [Streptomyces sp. NPDC059441]|uniref:hypothetical protein n=1 Tax=Streptomyces sp. NPDC059441 TaxID=3346829 RepID=UPI0036AA14AA